jgi:anti-sigma regulatory factor (Ser/Thr protein kinase)
MNSLTAITTFVAAAAEAARLPPQAAYRLRLAVDEICTNIILYAYEGRASPGPIELRAETCGDSVAIVVEDEGVAFDPRQVPAPPDLHLPAEKRRLGGLGVYLAMRNIDRFGYSRLGDRNRSTLVMNRPPASGG